MSFLRAVSDFVTPPTRNETRPSGPDWRQAADGADIEEIASGDAEYVRRINERGHLDNVTPLAPEPRFNPRKVNDEIRRLSVEISGQQNQIDELTRERDEKIERRRRLRRAWIKEAEILGCFDDDMPAVGHNAPPALPQEDES